MHLNTAQKICLSFFAALVVFWMGLYFTSTTSGTYNYLYSFLFGLIPLFAGIVGLWRFRVWGGFGSAIGKAVFFIALGIFCWGTGETIWSYYNFVLNVAAPYPSLADIFFAPSIFFYGLGAFFLSKATGAKFGLRNKAVKWLVIIAPFLILVFSYYLLVHVARAGVLVPENETALKIFLDIVYPFGDFVGLTISIIISGLSFKYLGGKYSYDIYAILLGLGVMFVGDTIFSYTTTVGTYYNADFGDLILSTGTFLLSFGLLGFYGLKSDD
jgi:hypothetical protein